MALGISLRPQPCFYALPLHCGAPLVPALNYPQRPMALPQPTVVDGHNSLDRSPRFGAWINAGPRTKWICTASSLQPVSPEEYAFRMGRRWACAHREMQNLSRTAGRSHITDHPCSERSLPVDQLALGFTPGTGHNQPPAIDPIEVLTLFLRIFPVRRSPVCSGWGCDET